MEMNPYGLFGGGYFVGKLLGFTAEAFAHEVGINLGKDPTLPFHVSSFV
jgi:hypothetical protein